MLNPTLRCAAMDKRGLELGLLDGLYQHFAFIQLLLVVLAFLTRTYTAALF